MRRPDIDMELDYFDDIVNHYKVAKDTWKKWSEEDRRAFNRAYSAMTRNFDIFPDTPKWKKAAKAAAMTIVK